MRWLAISGQLVWLMTVTVLAVTHRRSRSDVRPNTSCCGLAARATTHRVGFIDFLFPDLPAPLQAWAPEESRPHRR
jgi:hypothetical protein